MITKNNKEVMYVVVGLVLIMLYIFVNFLMKKNIIDLIYILIMISFLFRYIKIKK